MDPRVEVEIARRYLVDGWQSFRSTQGGTWGLGTKTESMSRQRGKYCKTGERCFSKEWHTIPDRILAASPHLQGYDVPGDEIDRLKAQGLTLLEALEELGID